MRVEFRKSFEKDLKKIRDKVLFKEVFEIIEQVEEAENLLRVRDIRKLKGRSIIE